MRKANMCSIPTPAASIPCDENYKPEQEVVKIPAHMMKKIQEYAMTLKRKHPGMTKTRLTVLVTKKFNITLTENET